MAAAMQADRRLCVDASQSRLVEAGSVESAFLLAGKGQEIPNEVVKRLGLRMAEGRVVQGPEPVAVAPVVEAPAEAVTEVAPIMPPESKRSKK